MRAIKFIGKNLDFLSALLTVAGKSTQIAKVLKSRTMGRRRHVLCHFFILQSLIIKGLQNFRVLLVSILHLNIPDLLNSWTSIYKLHQTGTIHSREYFGHFYTPYLFFAVKKLGVRFANPRKIHCRPYFIKPIFVVKVEISKGTRTMMDSTFESYRNIFDFKSR